MRAVLRGRRQSRSQSPIVHPDAGGPVDPRFRRDGRAHQAERPRGAVASRSLSPLARCRTQQDAEGARNGYKSQASAPGSEPSASARPKHTENSNALSSATPWVARRETTASSRRPQPPIEIGTSTTPIMTVNKTAASGSGSARPCDPSNRPDDDNGERVEERSSAQDQRPLPPEQTATDVCGQRCEPTGISPPSKRRNDLRCEQEAKRANEDQRAVHDEHHIAISAQCSEARRQ